MGAAGGAAVAGPAGAAIGAAGGAFIGSTVDERAARKQKALAAAAAEPPFGRASATPGMVYSPYTDKLYNAVEIAPGGLIIDTDLNKPFRRP